MNQRIQKIMKNLTLAGLGVFVTSQIICHAANASKPTQVESDALMAMIHIVNHTTLPYKATMLQQMLAEANRASDRLQLPMRRPIQKDDLADLFIPFPWYCVVHETNAPYFPVTVFGRDICDTNIPIELRLHALKFGVDGRIDTTNFEFGFMEGKLTHVMRLSDPMTEYYAHDLDKLVGQPSLIDTNGAYQLATQWLAAVDVDMTALNKLKWTVNQLHYKTRGATNYVTLPLYYVDFGSKHHAAFGNLKAYDEPLVSVEVLGTTKELQEILIKEPAFSRRPQLLLTNALDLVRTPNPPMKQFESPASSNSPIKRIRHRPNNRTNYFNETP